MISNNVPNNIKVQKFHTNNGLVLEADVGGNPDAQPVILLHGGGQTRYSWSQTFDTLVAKGFYVINLDARGHGNSQWAPDGDYHLKTLAQDLINIINTLNKPPIVIGASMGGLTALCLFGLLDQKNVLSLVLVDIVPGLDMQGSQEILNFLQKHLDGFDSLEEVAEVVSKFNPHRPRPKDISGLMKNLRKHDDGKLYWHWDPKFFTMSDLNKPTLLTEPLYEVCKKITIPVLLVRGMYSNVVTDQGVERLKKHVPHLQVFEVTGASHMITGDQNSIFNEGILSFIEKSQS